MSYAEIMIQAYATANGITREEAMKRLKISNLVSADKETSTDQVSDHHAKEILKDLRKDPKGVLAWAR